MTVSPPHAGTFAPITMDNKTNSKIMVEKLSGFWEWISNDTNVIGMNPWHWQTWGSFTTASPFKMGTRSRRRDCHSAALPSPSSRCFNTDGEGMSVK